MANKKVLIIKLTSLGDVIFNIPLANSLKDAGYEVSFLTSEKGYGVIKNNPAFQNSFLAPMEKWKRNKKPFSNILEYIKIVKEIRKQKFDIVIDSQQMFKSLIWMIFSGAKRRITCKNGKDFSWIAANEIIPDIRIGYHRHSVLNYLEYAKYLGAEQKIKFSLPVSSDETKSKIDLLLKDLDNSKPLVVISPATTRHLKYWHTDNWKELVQGIKDKCSLVFTGTKTDNDFISEISDNKFLNLAGKTDLSDLIELFRRASIVISPDAGSSHVAWATAKPAVISIFTITPAQYYGPFGDDKKYFRVQGNLPCQPCYLPQCPLKGEQKEACRKLPHPIEIINIVNNLLENTIHGV